MVGDEAVMAHMPALILHITAGGVGILAGWGAVLAAKGEPLHLLFGKIFVGAMAAMAMAAIYLATHLMALKPMEETNLTAGLLVLYLLSTSWMAVKRAPGTVGAFEKLAMALALGIAATDFAWGVRALAPGGYDGYRPELYFVFAGVTALFATLDLRVILKGGLQGTARIARHLSRMSTAWFVASASFFIGQQKVMPAWMHGSKILLALGLAPLAFLLFWMIRVRIGTRFRPSAATVRWEGMT